MNVHGKPRKIRRTGRHTAPSTARKVARRAGLAAPAVAVAGALAATLPGHHGAPPPRAGISAARAAVPDQLAATPLSSLQLYRADADRVRRIAVTGAAARRATPRPAASASRSSRPSSASRSPSPPRPSRSPSPRPETSSPATLTCSAAGGMVPENYAAIVSFLTAHGYTGLAAAGIAGNIYQESKGDPESVGSGGGGLIGWTPLPAGFVTGDVAADLQTQLAALLTFNQQWAQYIPALNAASSAAAAADIYMDDFERPGIPAAGSREAAATAVAQACGL